MTRARRMTAEAIGTALLLAAVVGSGIMGQRLAGGNVAIALLANGPVSMASAVTAKRCRVRGVSHSSEQKMAYER
jgi:glycerol uptake facilitator-like aquaporin